MLGLQNEREWKLFCDKVLQRPLLQNDPRFDTNERRVANRDELAAIIQEVFSKTDAKGVIARLEKAQIANAAVNQVGDLWAHPQLQARGRYRTVGSPAGDLQALLPPANNNTFEYRMDPIPALGEHTIAILRGLGRSNADIAQLSAGGIV
jgi:formyl-CoA transferase